MTIMSITAAIAKHYTVTIMARRYHGNHRRSCLQDYLGLYCKESYSFDTYTDVALKNNAHYLVYVKPLSVYDDDFSNRFNRVYLSC